MNLDGLLYVFALIGIITTAVAASIGIALTVTMARVTYLRFKRVAPILFFPEEQHEDARGLSPLEELTNDSKYSEKTRVPARSAH